MIRHMLESNHQIESDSRLSGGPVWSALITINSKNPKKKIPANAPGNSPLENIIEIIVNVLVFPKGVQQDGKRSIIDQKQQKKKATTMQSRPPPTRNTSVNTLSFSVWDTCRLINNWRNNTSLLLVSIQHLITFNSIMKTQIPTADGIAM
ncbi:hypothetical protein GCK72_024908 [Caenorhabditis remanei]|uniref:Uncharacterized protein n=1 Tax=Caenorhabditis remanei TaxID=31234 RepID=A0A6A5G110_CAERE|nr:hypothetical protein GCK72_024908 [Caenorhabditis remanei]KAF1748441.1 hypothetical protein GCK72_024908 [Caenorhabditis remanei]